MSGFELLSFSRLYGLHVFLIFLDNEEISDTKMANYNELSIETSEIRAAHLEERRIETSNIETEVPDGIVIETNDVEVGPSEVPDGLVIETNDVETGPSEVAIVKTGEGASLFVKMEEYMHLVIGKGMSSSLFQCKNNLFLSDNQST